MINDFGESKVTIRKPELLEAVRGNMQKHEREYREAYAGYRAEVLAGARALVEMASGDERINILVVTKHIEPTSHAKDYERVIRMLEMSTADEIVVTEQQFAQYVLDEWNWSGQFSASVANYKRIR